MDKTDSESSGFLGTYFERDAVLRMAAVARVSSWVILVIYALFAVNSMIQLVTQFSQGMFYAKGSTLINILGIASGYFMQPLIGLLYFVALQGISFVLLILLDVEDNTRRAARK